MDDTLRKIEEDPDFINLKRYGYSLKRVLERYPDGAPENLIAQALCMTEDEVEEAYMDIVEVLRAEMGE